ncbi:LD-carboxypeptidase [Sphingomonas donggukensis]|uniref:LD-carboxypeptidase n=1 Tax=Sphingomonas donggukensis TaxID=2949093 RepID=A0ABY4TWI1_9SPHN|nr:LD-carboxypeptidase [Sphingomonas donggukensis]URW74683.1 LD-carboxypeptidase [Sphingomonas donggukensis]
MKIAVVAPARSISVEGAARVAAFTALYYPEVELVIDPQVYMEAGHFAGPDAIRAETFLRYANDPSVDAIWFGRGGYGSNRILAEVMPKLGPAARTKSYMGFSDMGFLLGALYARRIGHPVHGPMASNVSESSKGVGVGRALGWLVNKDRNALEPTLNGRPAAAFNLVILCALIGTPWMPDLTDHVLYIEEVGEAYYRIDRLLFQMANATQLKGIAGVRLGAVTDVPDGDNEKEFGESLETMMTRWCGDMGVPYLGRARIGHDTDNLVVPFGLV